MLKSNFYFTFNDFLSLPGQRRRPQAQTQSRRLSQNVGVVRASRIYDLLKSNYIFSFIFVITLLFF